MKGRHNELREYYRIFIFSFIHFFPYKFFTDDCNVRKTNGISQKSIFFDIFEQFFITLLKPVYLGKEDKRNPGINAYMLRGVNAKKSPNS